MSEVNAYGYGKTISRGVQRGYIISSCTLFPEICATYWRGYCSALFISKGFPRTYTTDKQKWIPTFLLCGQSNIKPEKGLSWVSTGHTVLHYECMSDKKR